MPQEFSAGIIGFKMAEKPKFLLLKYRKGYWGFPRGHIEPGEDSKTAALRELKEETGLEAAKVFDGFKEIVGFFFRNEGKIVHKDVTFYIAEMKEGEVKLTEHLDHGWFEYNDADKLLQFKNDREVLKKANDFLTAYYR